MGSRITMAMLISSTVRLARKWTVDRATARARLFLMEQVFENSLEGIVVTDGNNRIITVNGAFSAITGYAASEAIGQTPAMLRSDQNPPGLHEAMWRALKEDGRWRGEVWNRRKNGEVFPELLSINMMRGPNGRVAHYVASFTEISTQKEAERRLVRMVEWLDRSNADLAQAVTEKSQEKERAEAATRIKSEFLATMSHEIRTPMNGVIGMLGLLADTPLDDSQHRLLATAQISAEALLAIINDILDLSKLEAGRVELESRPFSVLTLAEGVRDLLTPAAADKGVALEVCTHDDTFLGDAGRLRQVLLNLVGNAVKFTERGHVTLTVATPDDGGHIRFDVTDTGVGIPEEAKSRMFNVFAQADASTTRRFGGTGLGLAISKRIVELMDGSIGFDSVEGEGSTFWFKVPLVRHEKAPSTSTPTVTTGRRLRVLVVDDNDINRQVAAGMLDRLGHTSGLAVDGAEAVAAAMNGGWDVVLMDMQMPVMDGLEATRAIRALSSSAGRVPIIAMTANAMEDDRTACLAAGMDDYISKPIDRRRLATILSAVGNA